MVDWSVQMRSKGVEGEGGRLVCSDEIQGCLGGGSVVDWSVQMRSEGVGGRVWGQMELFLFRSCSRAIVGLGHLAYPAAIGWVGGGFLILQQRYMSGCPISDPAAALQEGLPPF